MATELLSIEEKVIIKHLYMAVNSSGKLGEVLMQAVIDGELSSTQVLNGMENLLGKVCSQEVVDAFQDMLQQSISSSLKGGF